MTTKNNTTESIHSPKNRYRAEINYKHALKEIGSVQSFTSNDLEALLNICAQQIEAAETPAIVKVIENMDVYPNFNWQTFATYSFNELGGRE